MNNLNLSPINCRYENFKDFSSSQEEFHPHYLGLKSNDPVGDITVKIMSSFLKNAVEVSNTNSMRNVDHFLAKSKVCIENSS